jgi:hypothetical protein
VRYAKVLLIIVHPTRDFPESDILKDAYGIILFENY